MQRWEYKVHEITITDRWSSKKQKEEIDKFESELNALGGVGWELVSYQAIPLTGGVFTDKVKGYAYIAMLKRPLAAS